MKNNLLGLLRACLLGAVLLRLTMNDAGICLAAREEAYAIKPWEVGQYVLYQVVTMEGESGGNRYEISIVGEEEVAGKPYFWVKTDISEEQIIHGHNSIQRQLTKNISFKMLVPSKNPEAFKDNPASFISEGLFPSEAIKLFVQVGDGPWNEEDPQRFFSHRDVLDNTPYAQTPDAKAKIDFNKLRIDDKLMNVATPAGLFSCSHLFVKTDVDEPYWREGFDLWRSAEVPLLGLVKMEFSRTNYWEKLAYQYQMSHMPLSSKRMMGRMRPDTCTILLLDYGPKK